MKAIQSFLIRFFWVSCEEIFTTETQRGRAATKVEKIFHHEGHEEHEGRLFAQRRQGAKVGAELNSFEECYLFLPNLASLRLGARNIRIRESSSSRKFAQATTTFKDCSTEFTEDLFKLLFLGAFLCALCASAVQTPIPAHTKA